MKQCIGNNQRVLQQLSELLLELPAKIYSEPIDLLSDATVGKHTRHIIDFYLCIMSQSDQDVLSYDTRDRDPMTEKCPLFASEKIREINAFLAGIDADKELTLLYNFTNTESAPETIHTTLLRELTYTFDHAVHHLATIKMGLCYAYPEFELPTSFGVAPSTIRYKNKHAAA